MKFLLLEQIIIQNVPVQLRNASEENSGGALNVEAHWDLGLLVMKLWLGCVCGWGGHRAGDKLHPRSFLVPLLRFLGYTERLLLLL